jgi:acetyl/propionyl-CoA carboxylase alpha subunit
VPTTISFHREIFDHPDFIAGNYDTSFLETKFREGREDAKKKSMTLKRPSEGDSSETVSPATAEPVAAVNENPD